MLYRQVEAECTNILKGYECNNHPPYPVTKQVDYSVPRPQGMNIYNAMQHGIGPHGGNSAEHPGPGSANGVGHQNGWGRTEKPTTRAGPMVVHGRGLVKQLKHDRHLGPQQTGRAAHRTAGARGLQGLQVPVDGMRAMLLQVQARQKLQLLTPGHLPLAAVPLPAAPGSRWPLLGRKMLSPRPRPGRGHRVLPCGWEQCPPKWTRLQWVG